MTVRQFIWEFFMAALVLTGGLLLVASAAMQFNTTIQSNGEMLLWIMGLSPYWGSTGVALLGLTALVLAVMIYSIAVYRRQHILRR